MTKSFPHDMPSIAHACNTDDIKNLGQHVLEEWNTKQFLLVKLIKGTINGFNDNLCNKSQKVANTQHK